MSTGRRLLEPSKRDLVMVKTLSVQDAATACKRSRETIRRWREQYCPELSSRPGRPRRDIPDSLLSALGTAPDAQLARAHKIPKNSIRNYRIKLAIAPYPRESASIEEAA